MVKRVFGRVDGQEVELYADSGDRWSMPVPFDVDGEYVVEILAEDEAGNQAYMTKLLFVVNAALLCTHLEQCPYYGAACGYLGECGCVKSEHICGFL